LKLKLRPASLPSVIFDIVGRGSAVCGRYQPAVRSLPLAVRPALHRSPKRGAGGACHRRWPRREASYCPTLRCGHTSIRLIPCYKWRARPRSRACSFAWNRHPLRLSGIAASRTFIWGDQEIRVSTITIFIDDLIAERWRESNTDRRTSTGEREENTDLNVCGEMISAPKSLVFFTKAYDLVATFDRFGSQMFEPNVRCELKRSQVNEAIRESINARTRAAVMIRHKNTG